MTDCNDISPEHATSHRNVTFVAIGFLLLLLCGTTLSQMGGAAFPSTLGASLIALILGGAFIAWAKTTRLSIKTSFSAKPAHWMQSCVQVSILIVLAFYTAAVPEYAPLIFYQLCFSSLLQLLLSCVFKREATFSFAVFPIVLSINLFIWFLPQNFYCQLLMVALAIAAKFFMTWKGGRHIFNPSGIAMAIAVYMLLALNPEYWGTIISHNPVAAYYIAPNVMLVHIFAVSCISLWLSDRFLVAIGAALSLAAAFYGGEFFFGAPFAPFVVHPNVFVGITLLITDPVTSPKNRLAQLFYGFAYGTSVSIAIPLLNFPETSAIFDKILFLPLLNLMVPLFQKIPDHKTWARPLSDKRFLLALYALVFITLLLPFEYRMDCLACPEPQTIQAPTEATKIP